MELLKQSGADYGLVLGDRLGRSNSKEQYAFLYNKKTIMPETGDTDKGKGYTYDDSKEDIFSREPFIARFKAKNGNFNFVLINIHTEPKNTTEEIKHLADVVADAQKHFKTEDDFIVLGDMNADCDYFKENNMDTDEIPLRSDKYVWLIGNDIDTTVAKEDCTYDRMIGTKEILLTYVGKSANAFRFNKEYKLSAALTKRVSDHFPIYAQFKIKGDIDITRR
jgi:deoxyribonuclease-1-like protein